ncbi:MAG: hypothetical protein CVT88_01645 [Candidatus Altiarchaeales archaeon HGW-Altiarchaeales-1]|nr:MAG: hypothetical protein CVT88_01645 [Candidatus Altiarchaeales archaeon HGW-Altiarchaeales-1]
MYAFIGIGQGGCGLLDSAFYDKDLFKVVKPIAINSTAKDLKNLKNIKPQYWLGMSKDKGFIDGTTKNLESYLVGGYGQDRTKSKDDAERQYSDLQEKIRYYLETRTAKGKEMAVQFAFLMTSLGGGTGSGLSPAIAKILKDLGICVIAVLITPAKSEGSLTAKNAVEALNEIYNYADSIILASNEKISYAQNIEALFSHYNDYIARSLVDICEGMTLEQIDPAKFEGNPPVIDMKDFITATSFLDTHKPGFSVIGRASDNVRDMLHYIFPVGGYKEIDAIGLIQQAMLKLSADIDDNARKNLCLLRLPHRYLTSESRMINTEVVRNFLLEKTELNETHFGISLTKRNLATATLISCHSKKPRDFEMLEESAEKYKG